MALIFRGKTKCSICGEILQEAEDIVATSHFIVSREDPLWRYSDSGMHHRCFASWPLRRSFVDRYNSTVGTMTWGNGTYHHMTEDGTIESLKR